MGPFPEPLLLSPYPRAFACAHSAWKTVCGVPDSFSCPSPAGCHLLPEAFPDSLCKATASAPYTAFSFSALYSPCREHRAVPGAALVACRGLWERLHLLPLLGHPRFPAQLPALDSFTVRPRSDCGVGDGMRPLWAAGGRHPQPGSLQPVEPVVQSG